MRGEDVARLQQELRLIGYEIQDAEGHYGKGTRQAVKDFQEQHDLEASGIVDEKTAQHINKGLEREFPEVTGDAEATFRVEGQIVDGDHRPISDLQVRVFDKKLRRETFLGESVTDEEGHYAIHYLIPGGLGESKSVNLVVRAANHVGNLLSESDVLFGAKSTEKINLVVQREALRLSDYEEYSAQLLPHFSGTSLSQINDEDSAFLAHASDLDQEQVNMLARSAQIAEKTNRPPAVLYGLVRGGLPVDPEKLVKISDRDLRQKIAGSVEENCIPVLSPDELDDVLQRVKNLGREHAEALARRQIAKSVRLQVLDENSGEPLAGHIVYLLKKGRNPRNESLGYVITDHEGMCTVGYTLPGKASDEQQLPATRTLKLDIHSPKNESIHTAEVRVSTTSTDVIDLLVPVPEVSRQAVSIEKLNQAVQLDIPEVVQNQLGNEGINTLADIRKAGRLADLPAFAPIANHRSVRSLEAHAQLNVLSSDSMVNESLIQAGHTSLADIADTPPEQLHADLRGVVTKDETVALRNKAIAQTMMLDKYAVKNLRLNNNAVTVQELSDFLYQPLAQLPASCREMDKQVAQVRLCIEVLRRYLRSEGVALSKQGIFHYLEQTYRALLIHHGIDYDALRTARSSDDKTKKSLADRFSLPLQSHLDKLILKKNKLSEDNLETLFGLVSTAPNRHPLSDGPVSGARAKEIVRWNLNGVEWSRNTDENGEIFVRFITSQQIKKVLLFRTKGGAQKNLVASGDIKSTQGSVELQSENNSGITGCIDINYIPNDSDVPQMPQTPPMHNRGRKNPARICLSCLPSLLGWRLADLRQGWRAADWPKNSDEEKTKARPFIDPDLIGPEYIRTDIKENPAWQLWEKRNKTLADRLEELRNKSTDASPLDRFNGLLEEYLTHNPGDDLLHELAEKRKNGESIEDNLTGNHLNASASNCLLRLKELVSAARPQIHDDEWEELYAILIEVQKRRLFKDWRTEEKDKKIILSPDFFIIPEKNFNFSQTSQPKKLLAWRATRTDLLDWEDCLQARIDQQQSLMTAFYNGVVQTEEQTLPLLRDSLLHAVTAADGDVEGKAKWVTKNLLIDASMSACEKTTRIGQAIISLQGLLWGIHNELLYDTHTDLTLVAPGFDEEWKWMGNYTTWRAAVFVFLYPENILLPTLRRHQTPAFTQLVKNLRKKRHLTPEQACAEAQTYSQYFHDVCNLELEASCYASTRIYEGECRNRKELETRTLFYTFARACNTNSIYMSTYDQAEDSAGYAQSFWAEVPGLSNVIDIVGAQPYDIPGGGRYVYLFVRATDVDEQQLQFMKYDLEAQRWIDTAEPLDLPPETTHFTAVVKQTHDADRPPHVIIRNNNGAIYERSFASDGTEWAESEDGTSEDDNAAEWLPLVASHLGRTFSNLHAALECTPDSYCIVAQKGTGIYYRIFGKNDDGRWRIIAKGNSTLKKPLFTGSFLYPGRKEPFVLVNAGDFRVYQIQQNKGVWESPISNPETYYPGYVTRIGIEFVNDWLEEIAGISLKMALLSDSILNPSGSKSFFDIVTEYSWINVSNISKTTSNSYSNYFEKFFSEIERSAKTDSAWAYADRMSRMFTKGNKSLANVLKSLWTRNPATFFNRVHESPILLTADLSQALVKLCPLSSASMRGTNQNRVFVFIMGRYQKVPCRAFGKISDNNLKFDPTSVTPIAPQVEQPLSLTEVVPRKNLQVRRKRMAFQFTRLLPGPRSNLGYLKEAYYFVPVEIARRLQARGHYTSALDWYRTVYDYTVPANSKSEQRKIFYPLVLEENLHGGYARAQDWLKDPLNPHAIAATRPNTYTRFTILSIVRCLLDYADAEFTQDTAESLPKARVLYMAALEVLDTSELQQFLDGCDKLIAELAIEVRDAFRQIWRDKWQQIQRTSLQSNKLAVVRKITEEVRAAVKTNGNIKDVLLNAEQQVNSAANRQDSMPFQEVLLKNEEDRRANHALLLRNRELTDNLEQLAPNNRATPFTTQVYSFCVSPNPVLKALRLRAKNSLHKIRTCRNIAGMKREVEPYAGSTDQVSGLPQIGAGGQLVLPGTPNIRPTPYRFAVLIERAKQLASQAQQMEVAMLSAIEKSDAEAYSILKARQDLALTRATVRLQTLRLGEAKSGVKLAELQKTRSEITALHYENLLDESLSANELIAIFRLTTSIGLPSSVSWNSISYSPSGSFQTEANIMSSLASYERRAQEWQFQKKLSDQDILIGDQQIRIADDRVQIVEQEGAIADLQKDHAKDNVEFLQNKFTNVELYDWMADTLEGVYSFFLSEATSVARLAENQLAFERQEPPPAFIQNDYWEAPSEEIAIAGTGKAPDRRGLTGSSRLLQDIYQLDQYAFETDRIQKPLSETISLAQMMPAEFQRFRDTGIIHFATPSELYDRKFPGQYLRLIRKVKTEVIALVPPTEGIHATLMSNGTSRVVIGGDVFQTCVARRDPEWVALTSPREATGAFELQAQPEKLLPFEGMGVDTSWELRMPKAANQFDYNTIADVLFTIDYTAKYSFDYYSQVIQSLCPTVSANRAFSFRHELADAWYDLHNPDQSPEPMVARFPIDQSHFPPNLDLIRIEHVVLYLARKDILEDELTATLKFVPADSGDAENPLGGEAESLNGMISTRFSSGNALINLQGQEPFGSWTLDLAANSQLEKNKNLFADNDKKIEDILLVITYKGTMAPWPQ
jgi:hypothetical protein